MVDECARMATSELWFARFPVVDLWVTGALLGPTRDVEWVDLVLGVDRPADELPWDCPPPEAGLWADATRLSKNPISAAWRSSRAPVWNHALDAVLHVWSADAGEDTAALSALRAGAGADQASTRPLGEEYVTRMEDELRISLDELRRRTVEYDAVPTTQRLGVRGDALHRAARAYLEVYDALHVDHSEST